jgi:hypothetical protein
MLKQKIFLIVAGFIIWFVCNTFLYPTIIKLIIDKGYPIYIEDIYQFIVFLLIGFSLGWFGRDKGWLLGLTLGILIAIFFIFATSVTNLLEEEIQKMGYIKAIIKISFFHAIYSIYLIFSAVIGSKIRKNIQGENLEEKLVQS